MDCLKNYIGIAGCGWVPPVPGTDQTLADVFSGLYVNQLPGISLRGIEKLADAEQENFLGVWKDVEMRALLKFELAFRSRLNTNHGFNKSTVIECLACSNKKLFSAALWFLLGTELMIERTSTDRINRYTTVDLEKANNLKAEFYAEYTTFFNDAIGSMDIHGSDCIIECVTCINEYIGFTEAMV